VGESVIRYDFGDWRRGRGLCGRECAQEHGDDNESRLDA
jgi:hypothetical protein